MNIRVPTGKKIISCPLTISSVFLSWAEVMEDLTLPITMVLSWVGTMQLSAPCDPDINFCNSIFCSRISSLICSSSLFMVTQVCFNVCSVSTYMASCSVIGVFAALMVNFAISGGLWGEGVASYFLVVSVVPAFPSSLAQPLSHWAVVSVASFLKGWSYLQSPFSCWDLCSPFVVVSIPLSSYAEFPSQFWGSHFSIIPWVPMFAQCPFTPPPWCAFPSVKPCSAQIYYYNLPWHQASGVCPTLQCGGCTSLSLPCLYFLILPSMPLCQLLLILE